jgi:hypothetical protein
MLVMRVKGTKDGPLVPRPPALMMRGRVDAPGPGAVFAKPILNELPQRGPLVRLTGLAGVAHRAVHQCAWAAV